MSLQRILYVSGGILNRGGIESFMMNNYRNFDKSKLQVDFIVHGPDKGYFDDEILDLGGKIHYVPVKSIDYKGNLNALNSIFSSNDYRLIHSHMDAMSYIPLKLAKKNNIPYRIAHSHNTNFLTSNPLKISINKFARFKLRNYATHYMACSDLASKWLFGNKITNSGEVMFVNNAIELAKYSFNDSVRKELREELGIKPNEMVVGHVGRFDYQKNHEFLIDIFAKFSNQRSDSKLLLVGEGFLKKNIEDKVLKLGLADKVLFLGSRGDIHKLLSVFDVFILPSLFEGLPVCLVEAQANGLPILVSDVVSKQADITGLSKFVSLNNIDAWVDCLKEQTRSHISYTDTIRAKGYDIKVEANKLENFYLNLLSK